MTIDPQLLVYLFVGVITIVLTVFGIWWGFIRWTASKVDRAEENANRRVDECHSRINEARQDMVTHADLDRLMGSHFSKLETAITDLNKRIDGLMMTITRRAVNETKNQ